MIKVYEQATVALGRMLTLSREDLKREDGQGATEYALVIAFLVIGLAVSVGVLGTAIEGFFTKVGAKLNGLIP